MIKQTIKAGVDWGSSAFRAYRFDVESNVVDQRDAPLGLKFVPECSTGNKFEQVLFEQIGDWLEPGDSVVLSGMVTSRLGWIETPYLNCPADLTDLHKHAIQQEFRGVHCLFLPGLSQSSPQPDVIRGEELQLVGAVLNSSEAHSVVVMPGTHSKWAIVSGSTVEQFHTLATGELFELLMHHSLIGQLATDNSWVETTFLEAVTSAYNDNNIVAKLFTARSGVLTGSLDPTHVHSYLSGLLIGNEIREGCSLVNKNSSRVSLVGSGPLCERYETALHHLHIPVSATSKDTAAAGFSQLIRSRTS